MSGTPTIMPKVTRSRAELAHFLGGHRAQAAQRGGDLVSCHGCRACVATTNTSSRLAAVCAMRRLDALFAQQRTQLSVGVALAAIREHAQPQCRAASRRAPRAVRATRRGASLPSAPSISKTSASTPAMRSRGVPSATSASFGEDREAVAAFGLVHVVRRHEDGGAHRRRAGTVAPRNRGGSADRPRWWARRAAAAPARAASRPRARGAASGRRSWCRRVACAGARGCRWRAPGDARRRRRRRGRTDPR